MAAINLGKSKVGDLCLMGSGNYYPFGGLSGVKDPDVMYVIAGNYYAANGRYHGDFWGPPTYIDVVAVYREIGRDDTPPDGTE